MGRPTHLFLHGSHAFSAMLQICMSISAIGIDLVHFDIYIHESKKHLGFAKKHLSLNWGRDALWFENGKPVWKKNASGWSYFKMIWSPLDLDFGFLVVFLWIYAVLSVWLFLGFTTDIYAVLRLHGCNQVLLDLVVARSIQP